MTPFNVQVFDSHSYVFLHMLAAEYSQIEAWEKPAHFRLYSRVTGPHVLCPLMGMRATSVGVGSDGMFYPICGFC